MAAITKTDLAALNALASIVAMQSATNSQPTGSPRAHLVQDRLDHYRRFGLPEGEVRRRAMEDVRAQG